MWLDVLGALVDRKSWKMANFQYIFDWSISVRVSFVWPVKYANTSNKRMFSRRFIAKIVIEIKWIKISTSPFRTRGAVANQLFSSLYDVI